MARAWAPLSAASAGALPPLCARSGGATSRFRAVQAKARAGWTWWLLPLGVVPFLVVRHFALEVTVLVPLSERIERRLDRLRVGGVIALLQAVLLIALGTLDAHRAALLLGVAFLLVAMTGMGLLSVRNMRAINANTVDISTSWLPSVRVLGDLRAGVITFRNVIREHMLSETLEEKLAMEKTLATVIEARGWRTRTSCLARSPRPIPAATIARRMLRSSAGSIHSRRTSG